MSLDYGETSWGRCARCDRLIASVFLDKHGRCGGCAGAKCLDCDRPATTGYWCASHFKIQKL